MARNMKPSVVNSFAGEEEGSFNPTSAERRVTSKLNRSFVNTKDYSSNNSSKKMAEPTPTKAKAGKRSKDGDCHIF